ncbi:MAG TPA: EAL domain-containing protein [Stellaceae bacterium]|nr:EAL domain-containing protein [Stellaceae bacterium]
MGLRVRLAAILLVAMTVVQAATLSAIYTVEGDLQFTATTLAIIGLAFLLGSVGAFMAAVLVVRSLTRPISELAVATRRFEAGDYSPPPVLDRGDEIGELSQALATMARAVAEREDRIRGWARHDPITNLLNRVGLTEAMTGKLEEAPSVLLIIGLVRLQEIVNTVGRDIADRLMQEAGRRLTSLAPDLIVACVSDSAFAVFVIGLDRTGAVEMAERIVEAFEKPYQERHLAIDATAAVGVALAPEHGSEPGLLLQHGTAALSAAYSASNRIAVYDPDADPRRPEHLSLMVDLREAVERKELSLHYQPKLELATGKISGVEALVRWHHEFRGLVPPDLFIPLAEETGNIQRLTRWALATGIAQTARWLNRGLALRVSVNLSVRDLADPQLPRRVTSLLMSHDVPAESLMLEVTESAIMGEPDTAIAVLNQLADQGIALSIDDFGIGQSSLAYLRRLPVRELKIDKSFVQDLVKSTGDQKIVQSVIELGHRLGYKVTAEGVENEDSLIGLGVLACDYAQGYHIAKPLSRDQMERFFTDSRWPVARIAVAS